MSKSQFDATLDKFRDTILQIEVRYHEQEHASDLLKQCRKLLTRLESETMNAESPSKEQDYIDTILACKMQLQSYSLINDQREELFLGAEPAIDPPTDQDDEIGSREAAAPPPSSLSRDSNRRSNDLVRNALRTMHETEEIGQEIGKQLQKNRETLEHTRGNVKGLQDMTGQANNMLTSMIKRSKRWF